MTSFQQTALRDVTYVWNTATEAAAAPIIKTAVATATTVAVNKNGASVVNGGMSFEYGYGECNRRYQKATALNICSHRQCN